jgi:uracil-DNA glycosylase family 4
VIGQPFVGPAGHLLNKIIAKPIPTDVPYLITNLVGCIPKEDSADKLAEPPDDAIEACSKRVLELVTISKPQLIVTVGKLPKKWLPIILKGCYKLGKDYKTVDIIHPAAILRMDVSQVGLAIQRSIVTLRDAIEDLV